MLKPAAVGALTKLGFQPPQITSRPAVQKEAEKNLGSCFICDEGISQKKSFKGLVLVF